MTRILLTTGAAIGIAVLSLAAAGDALAGPGWGKSRMSAEEIATHRAEMFRILDANGDGVLSAEELAGREDNPAWTQYRETRRAERQAAMFQALDTNGDGVVSAEEWAAAPKRVAGRMGPHHYRGPGNAPAPQAE